MPVSRTFQGSSESGAAMVRWVGDVPRSTTAAGSVGARPALISSATIASSRPTPM